jgi:hypothetical protein
MVEEPVPPVLLLEDELLDEVLEDDELELLELLDDELELLELLDEAVCRVKLRVKVGQVPEKSICRISRREGQPFDVLPS